jgi:type IV secretory pathway TrbD component
MSIIRSELKGGGNRTSTVLLGSLCLGLALTTALWFYGSISSWMSATWLIAVTVFANCSPLLYKYILSLFHRHKNIPVLSTTTLYGFTLFLTTCLVEFIGFTLVLVGGHKSLRKLFVAVIFAIIAAVAFVSIVNEQHGAWFSILAAPPLWPLWQMTLSCFLGLSLWMAQIAVVDNSFKSKIYRAGRASRCRSGYVNAGIFVAYWLALQIWTGNVVHRYAKTSERYQSRAAIDTAKSFASAPKRENLTPFEQIPTNEVFIMEALAGCHPRVAAPIMMPEENTLPAIEGGAIRALRPQRYLYVAAYICPNGALPLRVEVAAYPTADWAKYELRHKPSPNASILYPDSIKALSKFGNNIYEDGPYFFWSSGKNLVFLDCQGIQQSVIEEFLRSYLGKYPSMR